VFTPGHPLYQQKIPNGLSTKEPTVGLAFAYMN
jgi:hypothetical protein